MFELDTDIGWEVSQEADNLSKALFGAFTKSKNEIKSKAITDMSRNASLLFDSDDEIYTKKGLRKMKEKQKRKKKQEKKSEEEANKKSASYVDEETKNESIETLKLKKSDKTGNRTKAHLEINESKSKKRKHFEMDEDSPDTPKKKKAKFKTISENEAALSSSSLSMDETPKKKRKRNRKKKNNSKKNKYAHLALNRKEKKTEATPEYNPKEVLRERLHATKSTLSSEQPKLNKKLKKKEIEIARTSKKQSETNKTNVIDGEKLDKCKKNKRLQEDVNKSKNKENKEGKDFDSMSTKNDCVETNTKKRNTDLPSSPTKQSASIKISEEQTLNGAVATKKKKKDKNNILVTMSTKIPKNNTPIKKEKTGEDKVKDSKMMIQLQKRQKMLLWALGGSREDSERNNALNVEKQKKSKKEKKLMGLEDSTSNNKLKNSKSQIDQNSAELYGQEKVNNKKSIWGDKTSSLWCQAQEKLNAARFRYLNEQLYTCQGKEALQLFKEDPEAFEVYHTGFENQASKWPINPVNVLIKQIITKSPNLVIADFGCGDAKLAQALPQKVHSFDLVALNQSVKACDMSNVPLQNESVDIAVFCLSLMGTNLDDYICEANRVLKTDGLLKIVEVSSRFKGLSSFLASVCSHGFQLLNKRDLSQMFYLMDFKKVKLVKKGISTKNISLKPCLYKKR